MLLQNSRHSSILLGDTNTAKSVSWRMLAATITRLWRTNTPGFVPVQIHAMNPKALTLGELYGEYNLATGEWKDGVLSSIMRTTCQGNRTLNGVGCVPFILPFIKSQHYN